MIVALNASTFVLASAGLVCAVFGGLILTAKPAQTQVPQRFWLQQQAPTQQATKTAPGEILASTCAGCHGQDGNSEGPATPTIAGVSVPYFLSTMEQYRQGRRNSTIMRRVALGYNTAEIEAMAYYFASQKFIPVKQPFDPKRAERGAIFHKRYCEYCHRDGGTRAGREGILAGQWVPYLRATLTDMVVGKREMPHSMKRWMERLVRIEGEDAVEDLMHYYASNTKGTTQSLLP